LVKNSFFGHFFAYAFFEVFPNHFSPAGMAFVFRINDSICLPGARRGKCFSEIIFFLLPAVLLCLHFPVLFQPECADTKPVPETKTFLLFLYPDHRIRCHFIPEAF
jgi:hypothetical protein